MPKQIRQTGESGQVGLELYCPPGKGRQRFTTKRSLTKKNKLEGRERGS